MVAKKFAMKLSRSGIEAVLLLHMAVVCVILGSEREGFTKKHKKIRRTKIEQV